MKVKFISKSLKNREKARLGCNEPKRVKINVDFFGISSGATVRSSDTPYVKTHATSLTYFEVFLRLVFFPSNFVVAYQPNCKQRQKCCLPTIR